MVKDKWHYCWWFEDLCVGFDLADWRFFGINWMEAQVGINFLCFYAFVAKFNGEDDWLNE